MGWAAPGGANPDKNKRSSPEVSRPTPGSTWPPIQWVPGFLPGVKG